MDLVPVFLDRLEVTADLVRNVKTDQLGDPTPCAEFDVRALVNHFLGDMRELAAAAGGTSVELAKLIGVHGDHIADAGSPATAADETVRISREAWSEPGVTERTFPIANGIPGKTAVRLALTEAVVHGWDIAVATNQAYEIPDAIAGPMLEGMRKAMADKPRDPGGAFGPVVEVPEGASLADQLIGFTGRTPARA